MSLVQARKPSRIYHGGDYNPEQWPETEWNVDIRLMRAAGINLVTLPVFGWQALNPAEGVFTFDSIGEITMVPSDVLILQPVPNSP